jgi:hypothetical protein
MERCARSSTFRWRVGCAAQVDSSELLARRDACTTSVRIPALPRLDGAEIGSSEISTSWQRRARCCECSIDTRRVRRAGSARDSFECVPPSSSPMAGGALRGSTNIACLHRHDCVFGAATTSAISRGPTHAPAADATVYGRAACNAIFSLKSLNGDPNDLCQIGTSETLRTRVANAESARRLRLRPALSVSADAALHVRRANWAHGSISCLQTRTVWPVAKLRQTAQARATTRLGGFGTKIELAVTSIPRGRFRNDVHCAIGAMGNSLARCHYSGVR